MGDITFLCSQCGRSLVINEEGAGIDIQCPDCSAAISVPRPSESSDSLDARNTKLEWIKEDVRLSPNRRELYHALLTYSMGHARYTISTPTCFLPDEEDTYVVQEGGLHETRRYFNKVADRQGERIVERGQILQKREFNDLIKRLSSRRYQIAGSRSEDTYRSVDQIKKSPNGCHVAIVVTLPPISGGWLSFLSRGKQKVIVGAYQSEEFDSIASLTIFDDGRFAFIGKRDKLQMLVNDDGVGPEYTHIPWMTFSKDGRRLAYIANTASGERICLDGELGPEHQAIYWTRFNEDGSKFTYVAKQRDGMCVAFLNGDQIACHAEIDCFIAGSNADSYCYWWKENLKDGDGIQVQGFGLNGMETPVRTMLGPISSLDGKRLWIIEMCRVSDTEARCLVLIWEMGFGPKNIRRLETWRCRMSG